MEYPSQAYIERVIRNTYILNTYLVESYFADGQMSLRSQIYSTYPKFLKKLISSPSKEFRFLSKVLVNDPRSIIGKNIWYLNNLTRSDVLKANPYEFKRLLPTKTIPENEKYRIRILNTLLQIREAKQFQDMNLTKQMAQELIFSLCKS